MKYLVIVEKPSVQRAIQAVYHKHQAEIKKRLGELDFIALAGHVCRYLEPKEYPELKDLKWNEIKLPFIPQDFKITVSADARKKQLVKEIKNMIDTNNYDGIVVATDSDVEGNGIYYLLCRYLKLEKYHTLRFFEQSMTDKEILSSLFNMTDFWHNDRDIKMTQAFITRSQADFIVGMNATIALTVKTRQKLLVGRVKAPTEKIVYDNSMAIENFKPHSDYQVIANYSRGFTGTYMENGQPVEYGTETEAEKLVRNLSQYNTAVVTNIIRKDQKTGSPQLFKLSSAQEEAGTKFNYNPQKTQDLIQSLYEKKYVSYPRTDGCCISSEKAKELPQLLESIFSIPALSKYRDYITDKDIEKVRNNKKIVNDDEVKKASHDALIPTDKIPDFNSLTPDEQNIYDMLCRRLLAAFLPDLIEEKTTLDAKVNAEFDFHSTGSSIKSLGWAELYDRESSSETIPSDINVNDTLYIDGFSVHEKKSTPPKRLTTATLVAAMENIAKLIDDKDLKKVMKEAKGIGMPSTRAKIINDLIDAGFIEKKGKQETLYITEMGKKYAEILKNFSISDPMQAAEWESMFQNVKNGNIIYTDALQNFNNYINNFINETNASNIQVISTNNVLPCNCPYCGTPIHQYKFGFACEGAKARTCNFILSNDKSFNGKMKPKDVEDLINKGKTRLIKGVCYSSAKQKAYDAYVKLNPKGSTYSTTFEFPPFKK